MRCVSAPDFLFEADKVKIHAIPHWHSGANGGFGGGNVNGWQLGDNNNGRSNATPAGTVTITEIVSRYFPVFKSRPTILGHHDISRCLCPKHCHASVDQCGSRNYDSVSRSYISPHRGCSPSTRGYGTCCFCPTSSGKLHLYVHVSDECFFDGFQPGIGICVGTSTRFIVNVR